MKEFKGNIESLSFNYSGAIIISSLIGISIFSLSHYCYLLVVLYLIFYNVLIRYGNNSLIIREDNIELYNNYFLIKNNHNYNKNEISEIIFYSFEVTKYIILISLFMPGLKIIKIRLKDGSSRIHFCFGLEEDYYTNSEDDTFENLIKYVYKMNYPIRMTKNIKYIIFVLNKKPIS